MKFNYAVDQGAPASPEPEYDKPYGSVLPPVQARGNLSYLQFIDVLHALWCDGNPEIEFGPYGNQNIFNPELGYIIYSLEDKKPQANNPRPRLYEIIDDVDDPTKKVAVFIENFNIIVSFSAIHKNPRVAEEMMEAFEDFMIEHTPIFKRLGLEQISYVRRMQDAMEKRFGDDVASRTIAYMIGVQKILTISLAKLNEVYITAQAMLCGPATPSYVHSSDVHTITPPFYDDATPFYNDATPHQFLPKPWIPDVKTELLDNNTKA